MTEKELLEWKLPVIDMQGTNGNIPTRKTILDSKNLLFWKDFQSSYENHEIDSFIKQYDFPNINQNIKKLNSESSLQSFIKDILNNVFSYNILKDENKQIEFGPSETNEDADIVMNLIKNGDKKRLIDIEVKNPPVLNALENQSLYDYCISSSKQNQKPWYAINQLYGYMSKHKVKYGILTTYNQTWYLRHENKLYISNTILKNELLKSLNYFISLSLKNF